MTSWFPGEVMLRVVDLRVRYGGAITALRGVSMDVPEGAVIAVLGSNGAGKSTLLRAISGVLPEFGGAVDHGVIDFAGRSLVGKPAAAIVSAGVVQAPEGRRIFGQLTIAENLRIGGFTVKAAADRARAQRLVYELFPALYDRRGQRAGLLSGGQQQMLAIGRALMASPRLLLLDEPSLGLAPQVIGQIERVIREINASGTTVILVEQNATMALSAASHAYVLATGLVQLSGPSSALAADDTVRDLYLGRDAGVAVDRELTAAIAQSDRPHLSRWKS
jgi:ABC-type branched-subunit amino acid transport system ATPase component